MTVYGIQFWIECKGGSKTADELSDALDDLVYDGNLSLGYSNHSIIGAGLFMKNAVQNNFESIREILNEFADKIKYVSEWDYEDSSDMKWGVYTLGESRKSIKEFDNIRSIRDISKKELMKYEGEKFSVNFRGHNGEIWYDNHYCICYDFGNGVEGINYSSINQVIEDLSYEITESKKSARKSLRESDDITKLMKAIYKFLKKYGDYYFYEGVIHHYSWELSNNVILGEYDFNGIAINQTVKIYLSENYDGFYIERGYLNKGQINDIKFADTYTSSIEEMLDDVDFVCNCINNELLSISPSKYSK